MNTRASWSLADSLPLNQDVREALDLDDFILEVNATPNRGDCMSVFGIARDYAAASARRHLKFQGKPIAASQHGGIPRVVGISRLSGACHTGDSRRATECTIARVAA